ncbi:WXG100 family type VII secretion target [Streptacidiphilus sp. ASG 303]|uniref:WXG100 family type VII secretion target n=1 Tax=Streptacidiphilus sp. ASG 303 TaxID=2896847 RepID=UPI001E585854|nr:WXG100 family type VII secretion target [Streptacidiphilus sp. ASG 303]MCD0483387.1 WXG100 family type VII secretion target [Streptacidiphilus sp. ASG 303]
MSGSGEFSIHPADLRTAAPRFAAESERLKAAASALEGALARLGSPWGDDDQGRKFADAYNPRHEQLRKTTGVLVEGLASIKDGLLAVADNHTETDRSNADGMR